MARTEDELPTMRRPDADGNGGLAMDGGNGQQETAWASTQEAVAALGPWFHNLHMPDGTQTAPDHFLGDFPAYKWDELGAALPTDLHGWNALDVGCNAGFYCFELARRGARVTAIDSNAHYLRQARWAASEFGLAERIAFECRNVYALLRDDRTYDLVLFMGVLYHLRYPLLGLDILARRTRRRLALLTLSLPGEAAPAAGDLPFHDREAMQDRGWPRLAFVEDRFAGDPTTWWIPNDAGVGALVRSAGLRVIGRPGRELYICEPDPGASGRMSDDHEAVRSLVPGGDS